MGSGGAGGESTLTDFSWRRIDLALRFKLSEPVHNVRVTAVVRIAAETLAKSGARDEVRDEPGRPPSEPKGEGV